MVVPCVRCYFYYLFIIFIIFLATLHEQVWLCCECWPLIGQGGREDARRLRRAAQKSNPPFFIKPGISECVFKKKKKPYDGIDEETAFKPVLLTDWQRYSELRIHFRNRAIHKSRCFRSLSWWLVSSLSQCENSFEKSNFTHVDSVVW